MPRGRKRGKSVGDRLARMSVEQRKQYMERKAAQEMESLRRREELMGAYLKRKLDNEITLGKLNDAKLNVKWRDILRNTKKTSLKIELENLVVGLKEAVSAEDKMACLLRAQLQYAHHHRTRAVNTHTHTVRTLTCLHENQLQALTNNLRSQQAAILKNSSKDFKKLCTDFLKQIYHLHLVLHSAKFDHLQEQTKLQEEHLDFLNLTDAKNEENSRYLRSEKEKLLNEVKTQKASLEEQHREDIGPLQQECDDLEEKLKHSKESLQKVTAEIDKITAELHQTNSGEDNQVPSMRTINLELKKMKTEQKNLRKMEIDEELKFKENVKVMNRRASFIKEKLEKTLSKGNSLLNNWELCCKLQTTDDKLIPFMPEEPRARSGQQIRVTAPPDSPPEDKHKSTFSHLEALEAKEIDNASSKCSIADSGYSSVNSLRVSMKTIKESDQNRIASLSKIEDVEQELESSSPVRAIEENENTIGKKILSDETLQRAEEILRSQDCVSNMVRQLQTVKIQNNQLKYREQELREENNLLKQQLRSKMLKLGASDLAFQSEGSPLEVLKMQLIDYCKRRPSSEEGDDLQTLKSAKVIQTIPFVEGNTVVNNFNRHSGRVNLHK